MNVMKIFVDDTDYDTEDGFELFTENPLDIALIVKIAIECGFKDIRISEANADEIVNYHKNKGEN